MDTPAELVSVHNAARLPGLSLTTTLNLNNRPTAINPRSRQRPNILESIFPPQRMTTTLLDNSIKLIDTAEHTQNHLLFLNSFNWPDKIAAKPAAPKN